MENSVESNLKWLAKLARDYQKSLDQELLPLRLNASNYYFILKIYDHGHLPQEKLGTLTGLNGSNVTRTVQKLVDLDFVIKEKEAQDKRGFSLRLTEKGKKLYPQIIRAIEGARSAFLSVLTVEEQALFEDLLGKLSDGL
ncbi:MarR family winged helix-turn-helix transcriptional regulator [Enterococcus sp. DIV0876]|uniref:MarR family winged helix-turn-helix transcriptional regulator n=1 Tax=Enterococcus sp. DIV0876 TaxID=2774633 RepID=UPI003D2FF56C